MAARRFQALQYDQHRPAEHHLATPTAMAAHLVQQHGGQDNSTSNTNEDCKTEGDLQHSSPGLETSNTVSGRGGSPDGALGGDKNCVGDSSESGRATGGPKPEPAVPNEPLHYKLLHVECKLEMKALWDRFDSLGTEMIVTKLGRSVLETSLTFHVENEVDLTLAQLFVLLRMFFFFVTFFFSISSLLFCHSFVSRCCSFACACCLIVFFFCLLFCLFVCFILF